MSDRQLLLDLVARLLRQRDALRVPRASAEVIAERNQLDRELNALRRLLRATN